jgi:hypothetical protein
MVESLPGSMSMGAKEKWVKYWAHWSSWISPCYSPFSFDARFETYEPCISLIFTFLGGCSKLRILNQQIEEHVCIQFMYFVRLFPLKSAVSLFFFFFVCFSLQASLDTRIMLEVAIISRQPLSRS